jgi:hypothetical protein
MTCPKCHKGFITSYSGQVRDGWTSNYVTQFTDFCSNALCDYNKKSVAV